LFFKRKNKLGLNKIDSANISLIKLKSHFRDLIIDCQNTRVAGHGSIY